jgi:LacI family transcriptional regulator
MRRSKRTSRKPGHDLLALGVMRGICETGRVPGRVLSRDVGVIGGDNHPIGRCVQPALTTFSAQTHRAGKRMAQMLPERINGKAPQELQEIWAPEPIVRSSDGPHREPVAATSTAEAKSKAATPKRSRVARV